VGAFYAKAVELHVAAASARALLPPDAPAGDGGAPAAKRARQSLECAISSEAQPLDALVDDGGEGELYPDAGAAVPTALEVLAESQDERREQYSALVPPLAAAFPAVFPSRAGDGGSGGGGAGGALRSKPATGPRPCSVRAFQWALSVVDALGVTLTLAGVPQTAIVPLWPRLPVLPPSAALTPGRASQEQQQCVVPVWCVHSAAAARSDARSGAEDEEDDSGESSEQVVLGVPPSHLAPAATISAGTPVALAQPALVLPQAGLSAPALAAHVARMPDMPLAAQDVLLALGPALSPGAATAGGAGDERSSDDEAALGDVEALVAHTADAAALRYAPAVERVALWLAS